MVWLYLTESIVSVYSVYYIISYFFKLTAVAKIKNITEKYDWCFFIVSIFFYFIIILEDETKRYKKFNMSAVVIFFWNTVFFLLTNGRNFFDPNDVNYEIMKNVVFHSYWFFYKKKVSTTLLLLIILLHLYNNNNLSFLIKTSENIFLKSVKLF